TTPGVQPKPIDAAATQQCPLPIEGLIRAAQDAAKKEKEGALRIFSGPKGGGYNRRSNDIAAAGYNKFHVPIAVIETGASKDNQARLLSSDNPGARVGMMQRELVANDGRFQVLPVELFEERMHLAVRDVSPIRAFSDLGSKEVGVIGTGSYEAL